MHNSNNINVMPTQQELYQTAIKQFAIASMSLLSASLLSPLLLVGSYMGVTFMAIVGIFLILHLGWIPVARYLTADATRKAFVWYVRFSSMLLLPIAFMVARRNDPSSCLYYLVMPLSCYVMLPRRKVIGWAVFAFVLILVAYLPHCIFDDPLSEYLRFGNQSPYHYKSISTLNHQQLEEIRQTILQYNQTLLSLNNLLNLLIVFLHICLTLYYIDKLHTIRDMYKNPATAPAAENDYKYGALYRRIADFMESNESFHDPTFNISLLATATDSNVSYVSNAIREKTGMSFAAFINFYRVEYAKKELQQADAKYTIEHISLSAGFSHQTTFNRVFKESEGVTPTEYMNLHKKTNSDD